jgi:hypothetical protein
MNNNKLALALLLSLAVLPSISAAATFVSNGSQSFDENDSSQLLREITITGNATPVITAGYLDITIPEAFPGIFDDERTVTGIVLHGSAVDDGKVAAVTAISFLNEDQTIRIPIDADFEANDTLVIGNLAIEGFYSETLNSFYLTYQSNGGTSYQDQWDLNVDPKTTRDVNVPEAPSEFILENSTEGIQLTWTDPTDKDLWAVQIFRGTQVNIDASVVYNTVLAGGETFTDADVEEGETYYYYLRASDGSNVSPITSILSLTATLSVAVEEAVVEETPPVEETPTEEPAEETPTEETTATTASEMFSDEIPTWAEAAVTVLVNAGVVEGYADGTFGADYNLNRAEAGAMLWRVLMMGDPTGADSAPFTDVALGEWYTDYVSSLKDLGLVAGNPDDTFQPAENINRAEFLQLAMNVFDQLNPIQDDEGYELTEAYIDLDTSAWYAMTVSEATARGFVAGSDCDGGMCFNAAADITRAEASQILYNMFGASL